MTRPLGTRTVLAALTATLSAVLLTLSAGCGAHMGTRTAPATGGQPEHGPDESWFTTAGVTPEDPAVLLRELRAGRAPRTLGLVRSGAAAGASYAYVNWEWSLWPPGLRPVGVALTPVRAGGTTVAVGPVRRHGRVPEVSLRVARVADGDTWTAPLSEWQRAPHAFPAPPPDGVRRPGFTFQYVVEGEPAPRPLEGPIESATPRP